jgi:GT2 family glycosyltransferase
MFEKLKVIIINLDLKEETANCILSLLKSSVSLEQIILVDNGSRDGSISYLSEKFGSALTIIDVGKNLGYAGGLNKGIPIALEENAEWVLLMNNDTVVDAGFISELEKAAQQKEYFLLGPLILYYSQPERIWFLGDYLIPGTLITYSRYRRKSLGSQYPFLVPVDFVHGCAMMVHRSVFERIGFFDASSSIYGEEVDFIWRARLAGFRAATVPSAKIWHKISMIMGTQKPKTRYLRIRNQIRFYRRYSRGFQKPVMLLFTVFRSLFIASKDILSGRFFLIPPLLKGWWHGWVGGGGEVF